VRWCGDLTEIPTAGGKVHLAAILDLNSRRCVGFVLDAYHDATLARAALCTDRDPGQVGGRVVFHTDQGGEHTGEVFPAACRGAGITQSMGRTGSALDNAVAEPFNSTLEFEVLRDQRFATHEQARQMVAAWIDEYNTIRRHSTNCLLSPIDYSTPTPGRSLAHPAGGMTNQPGAVGCAAQHPGPRPSGLKGRFAIAARRPPARPPREPQPRRW
jgi:putative transposase